MGRSRLVAGGCGVGGNSGGHWRAAGAIGGLLRQACRWSDLALHRCLAVNPVPDPGDCTGCVPRPEPHQRDDRYWRLGHAALRAPHAWSGNQRQSGGLCGRCTRNRARALPYHRPLYFSECAAAHHRAGESHGRHGDHRGSQPLVPRSRAIAARAIVGIDAEHREGLRQPGAVDVDLPGHRHLPGRARLQPARRWTARRARSARALTCAPTTFINQKDEFSMTRFNWQNPYPTPRLPVFARNIVSTSHPLAAQAGLRMLWKGGNAVDAAIAAAAAITLVEPVSCGLGGDAFALVWDGAKLHGLNASGVSPAAWNVDYFKRKYGEANGLAKQPNRGWDTVTVPGVIAGWEALHQKFGSLPFADLMEPAIEIAERGHTVASIVAYKWAAAVPELKNL